MLIDQIKEEIDRKIQNYRNELDELEEKRKTLFESMKNSRHTEDKSPETVQQTGKLLLVGHREHFLQGAISALEELKLQIKRDFL